MPVRNLFGKVISKTTRRFRAEGFILEAAITLAFTLPSGSGDYNKQLVLKFCEKWTAVSLSSSQLTSFDMEKDDYTLMLEEIG